MKCRIERSHSSTERPGYGLTDIALKCESGKAYATIGLKTKPSCKITDFWAEPRGKGVGSSAYPLLEGFMRQEGCRQVTLRAKKEPQVFWRGRGFRFSPTNGTVAQRAAQGRKMEKEL